MVKNLTIALFFLTILSASAQYEIVFENYFKPNTLRVDFSFAGDAYETRAYLEQMVSESYWGGRRTRLDEFHGLGYYKFTLRDNLTGNIIYTDGFSSLFEEWQTSGEAKTVKRAFYNTMVMPLPFRKSTLTLIRRVREEFTDTLFIIPIPSQDEHKIPTGTFPLFLSRTIRSTGAPENSLDIVVLAEGYIKDEVEVFFEDAKRFSNDLFSAEVFQSNMNRINIKAIASISDHSGCDDPLQNVWAETAMDATFNTIGNDRYLMTMDMKSVRDIAGIVAYDQIYVLVNTDKFGGGGIFNCVNVSSSVSHSSKQLIPHELGHGFGGLGDEYTNTSIVHYNDYVDLTIEPWEPNLTTHVSSIEGVKWAHLIKPGTPFPTPEKPEYAHNKVGVFQGGGNVDSGMWRPAYDCRMRSNQAFDFCPVCADAIQNLINFYTGVPKSVPKTKGGK